MNGAARVQSNRTLLAALFATVTMLFTAFAAAYLEQRGGTDDWQTITLPGLLWVNTAVLALSSVTIEIARRRQSRRFVLATLGLGVLFLLGQLAAWMELRGRGIYLPSYRYASFFYILTLVHGLHLMGGLVALAYAASRPAVLRFCAAFWHFLGGVWIYVLGVLLVL